MEGVEMAKRGEESGELAMQQWEDFDNYSKEEKLEVLQKWANMDVPAIAVATVKGAVVRHPVLVSFWAVGLLIASLAGGLPVNTSQEEAYHILLQQAEVIDSRELGQQAEVELQKAEAVYHASSGLFSCDDTCQKAFDKESNRGYQDAKATTANWAMVTLGSAVFPDSDPEDEDFILEETEEPAARSQAARGADKAARRKRQKAAEELWEEMQKEELQSAKSWVKRPCFDPLFRSLQQRVPPVQRFAPKKVDVAASVASYGQCAEEGQCKSAKEMKQRVRAEVAAPRPSASAGSVSKASIWAQLAKYSFATEPLPSAKEMKQMVRGSNTSGTKKLALKLPSSTVVQAARCFFRRSCRNGW
ncbi:unnamed protein product [Effrenium voratum]|uniref:Uncharacterized protein n=1 Tax=Effrenium voratum TaxID=2562239 RepID=A0AA36MYY6_9DINO|nr:unnamed protein product [Effrenium voratum]